jgi:hypothetical protein
MHSQEFYGRKSFMHVVRKALDSGVPKYIYIVAVSLPGEAQMLGPGLYDHIGAGRIIDLRLAAPSTYLRPHAQHGLLVRPWQDDSENLILAAFQIPLGKALDWLGTSNLLSPFGLYPPATVDAGYAHMIAMESELEEPIPPCLGSITIIGPGY